MKKLLLVLFLVLLVSEAEAVTWYVQKSGKDTNCTTIQNTATPAGNIAAAMACAVSAGGAGNTVEIRDSVGAVYVETVSSWPSASAGNRFTLKATNPGVVTLRPSGDSKIIEGNSSHIQLGPNLILDGVNGSTYANGRCLMWNGGDDLLITGNELKNCASHGAYVSVTNLIFRGNTVHDIGRDAGTAPDFVFMTHGLYCENAGALIEQNTIYNIKGFGVHCYSDAFNLSNNVVRQNTIHDWGQDTNRQGAAILVQDSGARVYSNVLYNGDGGGAVCYHPTTDCRVYGNSINNINVDAGAGAIEIGSGSTGAIIQNNAVGTINGAGAKILNGGSGTTSDHNDTTSTPANMWNNPTAGDLTVKAGSPLLNAGVLLASPYNIDILGVVRPQGAAFDIGAYEQAGTLPVITITSPTSSPTFSVGSTPILIGGTTTQSGGTISWVNDRGGSGSQAGIANWLFAGIVLKSGVNNITVTATDGSANSSTDSIAITYIPTFPGNSLVAAYGFEEGSGTTVADSSGNGNTGTLTNGPTWTTSGRYGKALSFDGINDYVNVSGTLNNSLNLTQSFTISAWVQPSTLHTDFRAIVHKNSDPLASPYELYASTTGVCGAGAIAGFSNANGSNGLYDNACSPSPLQVNVWTHLAITYDGNNLQLYKNGALIATRSHIGYMEPSALTLQIGATEFGEYFQGQLDEIRLYNWAIPLTAGSNTVFAAACNTASEISSPSIVGDANCPIVAVAPPLALKISAGTTFKIGASAVNKLGAQ